MTFLQVSLSIFLISLLMFCLSSAIDRGLELYNTLYLLSIPIKRNPMDLSLVNVGAMGYQSSEKWLSHAIVLQSIPKFVLLCEVLRHPAETTVYSFCSQHDVTMRPKLAEDIPIAFLVNCQGVASFWFFKEVRPYDPMRRHCTPSSTFLNFKRFLYNFMWVSDPQNFMFCLFTCPERWKWASSLNQMLFRNNGFCSICSLTQLQNTILARLSAAFIFCFIWILYGNFFKSLRKILWTVDLFTLCSVESRRTDLFGLFSIARLILSMLAVDLPVFFRPLRCTSSTDPVSKNTIPYPE